MRKEDCKKGMLVYFGDVHRESSRFGGKMSRGVVIKVNPKKAKIQSIDPVGRWGPGSVWAWPYSLIAPVVGGDEVEAEMTMRSFANPNEEAVKAWSAAQMSQKEINNDLLPEDGHILRAIVEIYTKIDVEQGREMVPLLEKINILFRAYGRQISKADAEELLSR